MRKYIFLIAFILSVVLLPKVVFSSDPMVKYLCEMGRAFYAMEKYDEALAQFRKVLLIEPNNPTAKKYINDIFTVSRGKRVKIMPPAPKPTPIKEEKKQERKPPANAGIVIKAAPLPEIKEQPKKEETEIQPQKTPAYKINLQQLISEAERNIQKIDDQMRKQESKVKPAPSAKKEQAIEKQLSELERKKK